MYHYAWFISFGLSLIVYYALMLLQPGRDAGIEPAAA